MDSVSAVIAPLLGGKQNEGGISFCLSITPEAVFTPAAMNQENKYHRGIRLTSELVPGSISTSTFNGRIRAEALISDVGYE